jgi:predicted DNA-binding transcriptional regulator YafY
LKLNYSDREGKATSRQVEPLRLAHTGRRWYLVAWDLTREDWRTFRVDRIQNVISSGPPFVPRKFPGDVAAYVSQSIAYSSYRYRMRVKLQGAHEVLRKQVPAWCGTLEPLDETSCVLSASADSLEMLMVLILMTRTDFEILDSHELFPELRRITARLQNAFGEK